MKYILSEEIYLDDQLFNKYSYSNIEEFYFQSTGEFPFTIKNHFDTFFITDFGLIKSRVPYIKTENLFIIMDEFKRVKVNRKRRGE